MTVLAVTSGTSGAHRGLHGDTAVGLGDLEGRRQLGDFSWSYPTRIPPVPGGLTPSVGISYSSGSVDGRTSNTGSQPSWIGEGFDLWSGYIQRGYRACADDGAPKDEFGNDPGDQCWDYDNATVTWNGKGGELVSAGGGVWRLKSDDGTRFQKLTGGTNGDNDGEYWKATTVDGTQYFFGLNRLPGWASGKSETNSAWTVPVFGDDSGEPCYNSTFADAWCQQAWRWNLDYVVDPRGNAITYYYTTETNRYGRNLHVADDTPYDRGGYLNRIEYGLRSNNLFATAPAKVTFGTSERCIREVTADCAVGNIDSHPDYWPDVPWDLNCAADTECTDGHGSVSPTFWSRKRLTSVTASVLTSDGVTYRNVEAWTLGHAWGLADVDRDLLLESITHTGDPSGTPLNLPPVTFIYEQQANRVDAIYDDIPPFIRYRISAVYDETGGVVDVNYSSVDCATGDVPTPETNTRRCFPVYWQPLGYEDPIRDWFHKYVVTQVIVTDRTGGAPDQVTNYTYSGGTAWHYDDDDGLTKEKYKTWSQWRGYAEVVETSGGWSGMKSQTYHRYFRGMDGDRLNPSGGTKDVTVSDGEGGSYDDHDALAGFEVRIVSYDAPSGNVVTKTVNAPWRHQTASRTRYWGTVTANLVDIATTRTFTALNGGSWREARKTTTYETTAGLPTEVDDAGDVSKASDDRCTTTSYAQDTGAWLLNYPKQVRTVSVDCSTTPDLSNDLISDIRTYYDGGAFGAVPSQGKVTTAEKAASATSGTVTYVTSAATTYDPYGRPLTVTDAAGKTTTTTYTDTSGLNTQVSVATPQVLIGSSMVSLTTSQVLDPAFGVPTAKTDAGAKTTNLAYDALGRLRKVWLPNRTTSQDPNLEYAYQISDGSPVAVVTKTLTATGGRDTAYVLYDGLLRSRQTQSPGPDSGRLISDTMYNELGKTERTYVTYYATGAPEAVLFGVDHVGDVETQTRYEYDGLGRVTVERLMAGNGDIQELWRTTTAYSGDRTTVTPPSGGTPTTTIVDARGQITELRQYHGSTPTGEYDSTTYDHTPVGQLASVTAPGNNTWRYVYDLRGRKVQDSDPDKGTTTYVYDDLDRLTSVTDARGETVAYTYDALGRKTAVYEGSTSGTKLADWIYDTVRKGQPTSNTRYVNGAAYKIAYSLYDNLNRPQRTTYTIPSVAGQEALAGSYLFSTSYNLDNTVQTIGFPSGGDLGSESVDIDYDALQRPIRTTSTLSSYVTGTNYSLTGRPQQYQLGTGGPRTLLTYGYEPGTRRLASSRTEREGIAGVDQAATYSYDDAGNVISISDVSRSGTDTQCFGYDYLRRLTEAWAEGDTECSAAPSAGVVGGVAPYWQSFSYDAAGNRTSETEHGVSPVADTVRTYSYGPGHRLSGVTQVGAAGSRTDSFSYDAAGNTVTRAIGSNTQTLDWDAEGELASVVDSAKGTTSYIYDAGGDRLLRKDPGGTTLYMPGTELRLDNGAPSAKTTRYYTHNGQTVAMRTAAGVRFLSSDQQGTAQLAVNASDQVLTQRRFTPFGAERGTPTGTWLGEKGFVGGTIDSSTDLTHLGAREYDPATGRFISVDPLMDLADPQSLNGYAYADNNPTTNSDPDGLKCYRVGTVYSRRGPPMPSSRSVVRPRREADEPVGRVNDARILTPYRRSGSSTAVVDRDLVIVG